jgi:hypothetical protein
MGAIRRRRFGRRRIIDQWTFDRRIVGRGRQRELRRRIVRRRRQRP